MTTIHKLHTFVTLSLLLLCACAIADVIRLRDVNDAKDVYIKSLQLRIHAQEFSAEQQKKFNEDLDKKLGFPTKVETQSNAARMIGEWSH